MYLILLKGYIYSYKDHLVSITILPIYRLSSSGSSRTSTNFTTLGWSSFFMIAISRCTFCNGFSGAFFSGPPGATRLFGRARPTQQDIEKKLYMHWKLNNLIMQIIKGTCYFIEKFVFCRFIRVKQAVSLRVIAASNAIYFDWAVSEWSCRAGCVLFKGVENQIITYQRSISV